MLVRLMVIVVLAGGAGTRLRALFPNVPKPMVPVCGMPFLEYVLRDVRDQGYHEFIICVRYMGEVIADYFGDGTKLGIHVRYSWEKAPLGTGGAIGLLRATLRQPFCVLNGDTYARVDLARLIRGHCYHSATASIAVAQSPGDNGYDHVAFSDDGRVWSFGGVDKSSTGATYVSAGGYVFDPGVFEYIPQGSPCSLEKEVLPSLVAAGARVFAFCAVERFFDIGTPERYFRFVRWVEGGGLR